MSLRERVLGRIREERERCRSFVPGEFVDTARTLLPALLAEAQRQVEEHGPKHYGLKFYCAGCLTPRAPEDCPVVLAWARVFGEGE